MKKQGKRHIHFVGIKGVAMAALALFCAGRGDTVTGSDTAETFPTDRELLDAGITVMTGFDADHVDTAHRPQAVYFTGAHGGRDNIEVRTALRLGIPTYPHGIALGREAEGIRQIVVAGCHGKTTTSAMIATILEEAGFKPSYAIGCGAITGRGPAGKAGSGGWIVLEGDEYVTDPGHDPTPRFAWLSPEILVVTNIDYDHPDAYADLEAVRDAFKKLSGNVKRGGITITNADDAHSRGIAESDSESFGRSPEASYRIASVSQGPKRMFFTLTHGGIEIGEFVLHVPGLHNVSNAGAALIAAHEAGVPWDRARDGLAAFRGTARRFEELGVKNGVTYIDDYAHHPAEIQSTLSAARGWFGRSRIITVFQPHTYSRTKALLDRFSRSFADADTVLLTDIYASAREHDTLGITGKSLADATSAVHRDVRYCPDVHAVRKVLDAMTKPGDAVIFMGAGDIYNWSRDIVSHA